MATTIKHPKMPSKVKIGTQNWTVEERDRKIDYALNEDAYGYTLHRESLIVIDSTVVPSRKRQTLIHELMHAVRYSMGSPVVPKNEDDPDIWEHYFIGMYEEGLLALLRDNQGVVDYLLSDE